MTWVAPTPAEAVAVGGVILFTVGLWVAYAVRVLRNRANPDRFNTTPTPTNSHQTTSNERKPLA